MSAAVSGGITFLTTGNIGFAIFSFVASLALGFISEALAPKPKLPDFSSFDTRARARTRSIRQPITAWRIIYGEVRVGGPLTFIETTDGDRRVHFIVTLSSHEITRFKEVWYDDIPTFAHQIGTPTGANVGLPGQIVGRYVDSGGNSNARIKLHLGESNQVADTDLVADTSATSTDRGRGRAYIYTKIHWQREYGQFPNTSAIIMGKKLFDPRTSTTVWTDNSTLVLRDYLITATVNGGMGATTAELDDTTFISAANVCDETATTLAISIEIESVDVANDVLFLKGAVLRFRRGDRVQLTTTGTLPGGLNTNTNYFVIPRGTIDQRQKDFFKEGTLGAEGVSIQLATTLANARAETAIDITDSGSGVHTIDKNGEPRYTANGIVDTAQNPNQIIEDILSSMAGRLFYIGGKWTIKAGEFITPTIELTTQDFRDQIDFQTKHSRRERFNAIKGQFFNPEANWQATDYPPVTDSTFETEDNNIRIFFDLDLPFTIRSNAAQRIAKITLHRHRQQGTATVRAKLSAFQIQAGDNIELTVDRLGWAKKNFEVAEWRLVPVEDENGEIYIGVDMVCRETSSTVFDFTASTEERLLDVATRNTLPNPFFVVAPTNLTLASGTAQLFLGQDGTVITRLKLAWTAPNDQFVLEGGRIEIQFKKSADTTFEKAGFIDGAETFFHINGLQDGVSYDVRIRSVNSIGAVSAFLSINNHVVQGKSVPPADVPTLTVQQNGEFVTFKWTAVSDVDLGGYELRFTKQGSFVWEDATVITAVTRGTLITNAALPPGNHTIGIKAIDTTGNESVNATTANISVINTFNIITTKTEHPRWASKLKTVLPLRRENGNEVLLEDGTFLLVENETFIKHDVSDTLVPDSIRLANEKIEQPLNIESGNNLFLENSTQLLIDSTSGVFTSLVPNPIVEAAYEAAEIDIGFDATTTVRLHADLEAILGPGESGVSDPQLTADFRSNAGSYDGFESWIFGEIPTSTRFIKTQAFIDTSIGVAALKTFKVTIDSESRTETDENVTVAIGGTTITFSKQFVTTPNIVVTVDSTSALFAVKSSVTTTGFTVKIFDSGGSDVGGTVDWIATGV